MMAHAKLSRIHDLPALLTVAHMDLEPKVVPWHRRILTNPLKHLETGDRTPDPFTEGIRVRIRAPNRNPLN